MTESEMARAREIAQRTVFELAGASAITGIAVMAHLLAATELVLRNAGTPKSRKYLLKQAGRLADAVEVELRRPGAGLQ